MLQNQLRKTQSAASDFFNIDPRPVLEGLEAELRQPLPPVFSSSLGIQELQQRALSSVQTNIIGEADRINEIIKANRKLDPPKDQEGQPSHGNAQILEGKALVEDLAVFVSTIEQLTTERQKVMADIATDLDRLSNRVTLGAKEGNLYFERSELAIGVNESRSNLGKLAIFDLNTLINEISKISSAITKLDTNASLTNEYIKIIDTDRIVNLIPNTNSYPKIDQFRLTPIALGVLKYFYLSLPLLLVQIFIDFGYTIGLIVGVLIHASPLPCYPPLNSGPLN